MIGSRSRTPHSKLFKRRQGYQAHAAGTGQEGVQLIERLQPLTALIDIGLPEMGGHEVAADGRRNLANDRTYLVALTGYGQPDEGDGKGKIIWDEGCFTVAKWVTSHDTQSRGTITKEFIARRAEYRHFYYLLHRGTDLCRFSIGRKRADKRRR